MAITTRFLFPNPPPPEKIQVVDKPPSDGGVPRSVTLAEFLNNNNMEEWTETVHFDADVPPSQNNSVPPEELAHMLKGILSVREKLCLLDMGRFGFGVITLETLPPYTVIGFYAGDYCSEETSNPYAFGAGAAHNELKVLIDAEMRGNITRFIQHGPSEDSVNHNAKNISLANVKARMVTVNGVLVLVCETMTKIPKGRLLTLCYGPQYWMSLGIVPQLFTPNGRVASPQGYIYNEISVMVRFTQADGQIGHRVFELNPEKLADYFKVEQHYIMPFSDQGLAWIVLDKTSVAPAMETQSPFVSLLDPRVILAERSELKKNYDAAEALHVMCGIFSQSIKTSKKEQLRRISSALLPNIEWKYDAGKSCAFLQSNDKEKLDLIADHLRENRVGDVSVSKLRDSNSYILTVKDLNVSHLLDTPAEIGKKLR